VNKYREGKVKRTPVRGVKENLKPRVYKHWKSYAARNARPGTFCIMGLRVTLCREVKPIGEAEGKPSLKKATSGMV
jgi:hypothetical protein